MEQADILEDAVRWVDEARTAVDEAKERVKGLRSELRGGGWVGEWREELRSRLKAEEGKLAVANNDLAQTQAWLREELADAPQRGLFDAEAYVAQMANPGAMQVPWRLFPPGELDKALVQATRSLSHGVPAEHAASLAERAQFLHDVDVGKSRTFAGVQGFEGYVGVLLRDDLVVLDNLNDYGNALYILFEDWEQVSRRPRSQLLREGREGTDYVRVVHQPGWQARALQLLGERL